MSERILSICEAFREALIQEMVRDKEIILIGQDIGSFGGPFQITRGLLEKFGSDRVRETPISEAAMIGAGVSSITEVVGALTTGDSMGGVAGAMAG